MNSLYPRGNFPTTMTSAEIRNCKFHPENNPFCPIFRVGDVLNYTGQSVEGLAAKVIRPLSSPSSSSFFLICPSLFILKV